MPKVSFAFFATAVLFVLVGMGLGMMMGATEDFHLAPVHAHLNLMGWASMGLMGTFYALAGEQAPRRLAWVNYGLMTAAVLMMAPSLGLLLSGNKAADPVLAASGVTAMAGMLSFFAAVLITWMRSSRAGTNRLARPMPAE